MRRIRPTVAWLLFLCALAFLASTSANADLQVLESNVAAYAVGSILPDDTVFQLKDDERVKIRILPGNQTRVFEGRGAHTLAQPEGGAQRRPRAASRLNKDCVASGQCTPITVLFGTDRTREDTERHKSFGSGRSQELALGSALLTVPKSHGRGQIERPSIWDLYKGIQRSTS
jgi:hypothetical protein